MAASRQEEAEMERKAVTLELKADEPGALRAVFSTFDVRDKDRDVTLKGAFEDGASVRLLPAHDWAHYAIGRGVITTDARQAVFNGHFNLNTTAGRDWYESIKDVADMQEFSYGFDVLDWSAGEFDGEPVRFLRKIRVHEVSPVTLGAGEATRVLSIKSASGLDVPFAELFTWYTEHPEAAEALLAEIRSGGTALTSGAELKGAVGRHSTATTDAAWDNATARRNTRSGESTAYYRRIFAWNDPDGDAATKEAWSFAHHMVGADGAPGAANLVACSSGIGVLNGGRLSPGDARPWSGDRAGIHRHLAGHLSDGGREPPELRSDEPDEQKADETIAATSRYPTDTDVDGESGQPFAEQAAHVLADVQALRSRAAGIAALRAKEGRTFSSANVSRLGAIADAVGASAEELRMLLRDSAPTPKATSGQALADLAQLYAQFQQIERLYERNGVGHGFAY
jgi:HK97 family phage prohead protease